MAYDILSGNELVVGYDDGDLLSGYDVVGAQRRGLPQRRASHAAPRQYAPQGHPHGTLLKEQAPTKDGQLVLPMSSSAGIAPAAAATITARPQTKAYRPERVVIANSIAAFFTLSDIKVGNKSQFVQAGTIPAEAFIQGAFGVEMRMDTVQTAQDFVFQVNNIDATTTHTFLAVVFGRTVD